MGKRRLGLIIMMTLMMLMYASVPVFALKEVEPNENMQQANAFKMGVTVYGHTDSEVQDDWFKFKAPVSGTAKITVRLDDAAEFKHAEIYATVYKRDMNELGTVTDAVKDDGSATLRFNVTAGKTYYIVCSGWSGTKDPGWAQKYDYHFKVGYAVDSTYIRSLTGRAQGFTVKWNKKSNASFYQVQYVKKSTYQKSGWGKAKKVKVSKKYSSKKFTKLSKNKTYYVRVRVARTINGKTYYSKWSDKKAIKTKPGEVLGATTKPIKMKEGVVYSNYDFTGDGKSDDIKVCKAGSVEYEKVLNVYLNGKCIQSIDLFKGRSVYIVAPTPKKVCLLTVYYLSGASICEAYRYSNGQFVCTNETLGVLDYSSPYKNTKDTISIETISGRHNQNIFSCEGKGIKLVVDYKLEGNQLILKSHKCKLIGNKRFEAIKSFRTSSNYKTTNKEGVRVKKGQTVTIKKARMVKRDGWYYMTYLVDANGNTGWIQSWVFDTPFDPVLK